MPCISFPKFPMPSDWYLPDHAAVGSPRQHTKFRPSTVNKPEVSTLDTMCLPRPGDHGVSAKCRRDIRETSRDDILRLAWQFRNGDSLKRHVHRGQKFADLIKD